MPRFFFEFRSTNTCVTDPEGQELPDEQAAVNEAKQIVGELSHNRGDISGSIRVLDEGRRVIHNEPLFMGELRRISELVKAGD
jgi:hypothetical protein